MKTGLRGDNPNQNKKKRSQSSRFLELHSKIRPIGLIFLLDRKIGTVLQGLE